MIDVHLCPLVNMKSLEQTEEKASFLQAVLESFVDGILVLTDAYRVVYANAMAQSLCPELSNGIASSLPPEMQQVCKALIDSRDLYGGDRLIMLESAMTVQGKTFRIRAQWFKVDERRCLLLRLQDQQQSTQSMAIAEAQKWGLTPREAEVWLLRRSNHKRKEIAAALYITDHTVHKHLKNISLKRQAANDEAAWEASWAS